MSQAENFADFVKTQLIKCKATGLEPKEAEMLINRYGSNTEHILSLYEQLKKQEQHSLPLLLRAQLHYCIEHEMCCTPSDFFIRRTGAQYFDISTVKQWKDALLEYMQQQLKWENRTFSKSCKELELADSTTSNIYAKH